MNLFLRVVAIMALAAWLIWPASWGLGAMIGSLYFVMPVAASALALVVALVIVTLAPLSHERYTLLSIIVLVLAVGLAHFKAWSIGALPLDDYMAWAISLVLCAVFVFIAWPMIATVVWQKTHYKRAVDASSDENEGGHL